MKTGQKGIALIKSFESCKLEAYPDPGTGGEPWTIGWGHTKGVKKGDKCTQAQADKWLVEDLTDAEAEVNKWVRVPLTQEEFDALVSFVYNAGGKAFMNSTLLRMLNAGDKVSAAGQFPRWIFANGKKLPGLVRRREEEKKLFLGLS